jgi:hypothetical protein
LVEKDRSVFIAECKFWKGPASLTGALEQLLDYATWRDAKAAPLIFSRNKDFSQVLAEVPETLEKFSAKESPVTRISDSVFHLKVCQRDNQAKLIGVLVMVFNLLAERSVSDRINNRKEPKE